uniref:Folylpolyglutamate synthase n=1 Tax=Strongyloides venezuelensis TaxID=75913 RepID=A0A0K0FCC4_STRVS
MVRLTFLQRSFLLQSSNHIMEKLSKCNLYDDAIIKLNSLISNAKSIEEAKKSRMMTQNNSLPLMKTYFEACNININDLDKLNVIHIAGSKGKGTTSAMIEALLRDKGYKTGFFSSPHLVNVTERIRINGEEIDKITFSKYFFDIYNRLVEGNIQPLPGYFRFLTILAYYTFLSEKIDVAIMEVGIGGEYDSTNIIRKPIVCGITSLDYDHTSLLGNTLKEIAWHKSGIMKESVPCITIPQENEVMDALHKRSYEKKCKLIVAREMDERLIDYLQLTGKHQLTNLSLATKIAQKWEEEMVTNNKIIVNNHTKNVQSVEYLQKLFKSFLWRGRTQKVVTNGILYMLDGAHTQKSIEVCCDWFMNDVTDDENGRCIKVLLFTTTGERNGDQFLEVLKKCNFDLVLFSSTIVKLDTTTSNDKPKLKSIVNDKCQENKEIWEKIGDGAPSFTFPAIENCVKFINTLRNTTPDDVEIRVLVTGSLHLVGGVLSIIEK